MLSRARTIVECPSRPDAMLLVNYMQVGQEILPMNAQAGVGTFFVVEGIGSSELYAATDHGQAGGGYLGEIALLPK